MANVFKRPADKAKGPLGKWTISYKDSAGKFRTKVGYTDKVRTEKLAAKLETEAAEVRDGLVDPAVAARRESNRRPIGEHLREFVEWLEDKGRSREYRKRMQAEVSALLDLAGVSSLEGLTATAIDEALGKLRRDQKSARTLNYKRAQVKAFVSWLDKRRRVPVDLVREFREIERYNEKLDRRRVRRALTPAEVARLLAAVEASAPRKVSRKGYQYEERWMSGPERGALYRLALGTGFRVNELRSLRPVAFRLDGDDPTVTLKAEDEKSGKGTVQPITRDLAARLRPIVEGKPADEPAFIVLTDMVDFLRRDLKLAGIPYKTAEGYADFHSLRHTFITNLVSSGVQPKVAQDLARHSTITLTMDRYAHASRAQLRASLELGGGINPAPATDPSTETDAKMAQKP